MNPKVYISLIAVGFFGAGVVAGVAYGIRYTEDEVRRVEDEIAEIRKKFWDEKTEIKEEAKASQINPNVEIDRTAIYNGIVARQEYTELPEEIVYSNGEAEPEEEPDEEPEEDPDALPIEDARMFEVKDPNVPYKITEEEFRVNEDDHTQTSLVYFIKDDILVDEDEQIVNDVEDLVDGCLDDFSVHTPATVAYIRNERLKLDIEVVLDTDDYIDIDIDHEFRKDFDTSEPRKFRDTNE